MSEANARRRGPFERARRGLAACRLPPPTGRDFQSVLDSYLGRFQYPSWQHSRVQKARTCPVALQNTLDRPKPETSLHPLSIPNETPKSRPVELAQGETARKSTRWVSAAPRRSMCEGEQGEQGEQGEDGPCGSRRGSSRSSSDVESSAARRERGRTPASSESSSSCASREAREFLKKGARVSRYPSLSPK